MEVGFFRTKLVLFTCPEDFRSAYVPDNNRGFYVKIPLPSKSKMHNGDIQKKCYRPNDTIMGNTYILKGGNID